MRINHFPCLKVSNDKHIEQRKRKLEAASKIDEAIKTALDELETQRDRRAAFLRLLAQVRAQTSLLKPTPGRAGPGWSAPVFLIKRLKNFASRQGLWLRPAEAWRAGDGGLREESRSLARHLFAVYAVPGFMDSVWDLPEGADAFRQQAWFIRLGRGAKLRSLNLPVVLTRQMEHHARRAPDHYTVIQALRYGEARGLGSSRELACEAAASRLGRDSANAPFWRTVLRFFVAHPEMPIKYVSPIVDCIHGLKFAGEEVQTANGSETRAAPWPGFAMEGRTLVSLLRLVRSWNPDLDGGSKSGFSWERSNIQAYRYVERRRDEPDLEWSIVELLNSSALHAEGRAMHHCVFTYADKCRSRDSSIWSLRLRIDGGEKRITTIEVDPRCRAIVQLRGKWNRAPGRHAHAIIGQWAAHAGIRCIDDA